MGSEPKDNVPGNAAQQRNERRAPVQTLRMSRPYFVVLEAAPLVDPPTANALGGLSADRCHAAKEVVHMGALADVGDQAAVLSPPMKWQPRAQSLGELLR